MANMSNATMTTLVDIYSLNEAQREKYMGIIAFLIILMITGIIGNVLVLIIYKTKFKRSSARVYILSLALADLSVCIVGIPYHALDLWMQLIYNNAFVCKTLSYLISACSLSSVFILLVVGFDRFLKVCRPLKKQIIDFGDRKACIIATVVACLINIPTGIIYGHSSVQVEGYNITGTECFIDNDYVGSGMTIGYLGVYLLIFVLSVAYLIFIYALICKTIYQRGRSSAGIITTKSECICCIVKGLDDDADVAFKNDDRIKHNIGPTEVQQVVTESQNNAMQDRSNFVQVHKPKKVFENKKTSHLKSTERKTIHKVPSASMIRHVAAGANKNEKHTRKITLMMFTITTVFIFTYLPFIVISILDSIDDDFWKTLSAAEKMLADFLLRFYLFSNVANPIIYGFWDKRFRREVVKLFRRVLCCCKGERTGNHFSYSRRQTTQTCPLKTSVTHIK